MIVYHLLSFLFAPAYLLVLTWCKNMGILRYRLGRLPASPPAAPRIYWIHGASLGEINSIKPVVKQLKIDYPDAHVLVTSSTVAGFAAAQENYPETANAYLPLDTPLCLWWAWKRVRPTHLIITEAERWPGLCSFANWYGTQLIGLNTYITPARLENRLQKTLCARLYKTYNAILTQSLPEFADLKLNTTQIHECGSLKAGSVLPLKKAVPPSIPVLFAGSIHEDELIHYKNLWRNLYAHGISCHMVLVPRHMKWQEGLEKNVSTLPGTTTHLSSHAGHTASDVKRHLKKGLKTPGVTTISMIGVMHDVYKKSSIFYLGGTFNTVGGHNVLEPAGWTLPIIAGPCISATNYEAHALAQAGGLHQAVHERDLYEITTKLLASEHLRTQMGKKNAAWVKSQAASVKKLLALISSF